MLSDSTAAARDEEQLETTSWATKETTDLSLMSHTRTGTGGKKKRDWMELQLDAVKSNTRDRPLLRLVTRHTMIVND